MICVFFAHGFEEIEAVTIVDVLRRGKLDVKSVGIGGKTITGAHGITVHCDISHREMNLEKITAVILPGGMPGTTNLAKSQLVIDAIYDAVENKKLLAAICAAPMILGELGVLEGKKATVYKGMQSHLKGAQHVDQPVVIDANIITANGPSAAIAFSLAVVEYLGGAQLAKKVGDSM